MKNNNLPVIRILWCTMISQQAFVFATCLLSYSPLLCGLDVCGEQTPNVIATAWAFVQPQQILRLREPLGSIVELQEEKTVNITQSIYRISTVTKNVLPKKH